MIFMLISCCVGVEKVHVIQVVDILGLQVYLGVVLVLCSLHTHTRIILEHLSGGASMKRIKKKEERKRRGEKTREEKKRGRNKRDERKKRCFTGNRTQDLPGGWSKL